MEAKSEPSNNEVNQLNDYITGEHTKYVRHFIECLHSSVRNKHYPLCGYVTDVKQKCHLSLK